MKLKKKILFYCILINFPFIFLLSVDFIVTKIFFPNNSNAIIQKKVEHRISHQIFHHHLKPLVDVLEDNGKYGKNRLITNSLGFKDKEKREIKPKINEKRILLIGDSFTEGVLLNYEDTFAGMIDEELLKKNVEVLNAGLSSYSPTIYFKKIKYLIENERLNFKELVIFLDISDIWNEATTYTISVSEDDGVESVQKQDHMSLREWLSIFLNKNFYGTYLVTNFIYDTIKKRKNISQDAFIDWSVSDDHPIDKWPIKKKFYKEYGIDGIKKAEIFLQKIIDLNKEHKIETTIVVYPWISNIYYNDLDSLQVEIWKKFSQKNKIKFLNLFPFFIEANRDHIKNKEIIKEFFIPFDIHYNKRGHEVIAKAFLDFYNKN